MMFSRTLSLVGLATFATLASSATTIEWTAIAPLPTARSDLTATVSTATGEDAIYLIGGCDADQLSGEYGFYCPSVTARCDAYNPAINKYTPCAAAPGARYRHAAVNIDGKVWLVGGDDAADNGAAYKDIEYYDPATDTWTTFGTWDGATTDCAAFAIGTDLYIVGGYNPTDWAYTAQSAVYKVDTTADTLALTLVAELPTARGDIFATVADDHVYVTGGYTHTDDYCAPLHVTERYDLIEHTWDAVANTIYNRGDKALVHMNDFLYAIGGETKVDCGDSVPVELVEIYDIKNDVWVADTVIPSATFRFVAVGDDNSDAIYLFGGQLPQTTCTVDDVATQCYPVTTKALKFVDTEWVVEALDAAASGVYVAKIALGVAAIMVAAIM